MRTILFAAILPFSVTTSAWAQAPRVPNEVEKLHACRDIGNSERRLACYDAAVDQLQRSIGARKIVVMDRDEIRRTKRSLFGLTLSDLPFIGDKDADDIEINTSITAARQLPDGKWRLQLAEGGVWHTLESRDYGASPRSGQKVRIRKAAMGSYLMNIAGQRALRVRRQN
ncbi:hypothetical protein [Sphingosinicella rhizophila]|uniref:Uncharacterized protein n=1 Tax=Sphingosinicella rhizophila TaxID=3050082 RepID=A0ABU3QC26_9SPHN|nr:hypothetical protein [Sphingosinicella sp. GR2756]MDT9600944.1 hypothetical protein [Sphingosinicella sp. GR2756]